ncbi:MAG: acetaldehyde dehydrogenase, partial [Anaerolineales bacterium]|nr:acetaldehyde dehydrogenase [Anaerolineales bacterium]
PQYLAALAGIRVPDRARILVARLNTVGRDEPLSREKLTTVLGWYEVDGWEAGCERCIELIQFGGRGHSLVIHATDEKIIMAFGLEKPVFRIAVNTMGTLGAIGLTTKLMPSLTLGSGGIGGAITGDNVTVYHLFNVKRMAFETKAPPEQALRPGMVPAGSIGLDPQQVAAVVEDVVKEILKV